jgi:LuxR family maltose regulon positive regulatory protein
MTTTAGSPPDGKPPERNILLATKIQVPRSRPGLVARPRLADQLGAGRDRGLVLVTAPAGYGPTSPVSWPPSPAAIGTSLIT